MGNPGGAWTSDYITLSGYSATVGEHGEWGLTERIIGVTILGAIAGILGVMLDGLYSLGGFILLLLMSFHAVRFILARASVRKASDRMKMSEAVFTAIVDSNNIEDAEAFREFAKSFDEDENGYLKRSELDDAARVWSAKQEKGA
ncbi:MAG: hypothetical protein QGF72_00855 [Candidatus Poseidoniaceae archaeon]|jgi:hypothetical protein|nr:hypothetical protein [Candidatus Poseidoniaceae archaeon]